MRKEGHGGCDSVFKPRASHPFDKYPRPMTARIATSLPGQSGDNSSQSCDCSSKESEWFVFDHEVVMPEYIVDFEYVTVVSI